MYLVEMRNPFGNSRSSNLAVSITLHRISTWHLSLVAIQVIYALRHPEFWSPGFFAGDLIPTYEDI